MGRQLSPNITEHTVHWISTHPYVIQPRTPSLALTLLQFSEDENTALLT